MAVNCATVPAKHMAVGLCGNDAVAGARRRKAGCFEAAAGSVIYFDYIVDLCPNLQAKLRYVLPKHTNPRAAATQRIAPDVRVVAASAADLEHAMVTGQFRVNLF